MLYCLPAPRENEFGMMSSQGPFALLCYQLVFPDRELIKTATLKTFYLLKASYGFCVILLILFSPLMFHLQRWTCLLGD